MATGNISKVSKIRSQPEEPPYAENAAKKKKKKITQEGQNWAFLTLYLVGYET